MVIVLMWHGSETQIFATEAHFSYRRKHVMMYG
jgi:hypothetical protein